jgi:hypothetical protein
VIATPLLSGVAPLPAVTVSEALALWVAVVEVPVTVKVAVADGAPAVAVSVKVELPPVVTEVGLKEPVTPVGRPDTDSATLCALPLTMAVLTVNAVELPAANVPLEGESAIEKSAGGVVVTVRLAEALCEAVLEVPVTVKVAVVAAAPAAAVTVKVELPPVVTEVGLKEPVTPEGRPDTESAMLWALPLTKAVLTV